MRLLGALGLATLVTFALGADSDKECSSLEVRREWRTFSKAERKAWIDAQNCLNKKPSNGKLKLEVDTNSYNNPAFRIAPYPVRHYTVLQSYPKRRRPDDRTCLPKSLEMPRRQVDSPGILEDFEDFAETPLDMSVVHLMWSLFLNGSMLAAGIKEPAEQGAVSLFHNDIPAPTLGDALNTGRATNIAQDEFDEYGAEAEPGARVWKTFVKEADKFDIEQVDGWNSSLDVTLIFAALFTSICTAFAIESSKSLKADPAETSAQQLNQIASILLIIANISNRPQLNSTEIISPIALKPFSPRPVDLCVNALWFFSLILSAAVALISMLAKEWCYLFISGRVGDPWTRAKRRQQRWKGIKTWKMEQVIMVLPSFIHLSFVSFAIALCIYLGDLNQWVAIPATLVTLGAIFVYTGSTLLYLFDTICPYSTSISKLIQQLKGSAKNPESNSQETDLIAVEALAWLIETSEDPNSVDVALQAIAGVAHNNAYRELLKGAETMISRRLMALEPFSGTYSQVLNLYTRGQSFFRSPMRRKEDLEPLGEEVKQNANWGPGLQVLQDKIRNLRDMINGEIFAYVKSPLNVIFSAPAGIQGALWIGSTAPSYCSRSLQSGMQFQTQKQLDFAMELLEEFRDGSVRMGSKELHYMMTGVAVLLCSLLVECSADIGARYVMRLLRTAHRANGGQRQLPLEYLSLPLVVYALSQRDYPGWTQPPPLSPTSRAERAIEIITHYVCHRERLGQVSPFMINLALLELISNPEGYKLDGTDIVAISEAFNPTVNDQTHIHTFPEHPLQDSLFGWAKGVEKFIPTESDGPLSKDAVTITCLTMLDRTRMNQSAENPPLGEVYAFVIECVLTLPFTGTEADGLNAALNLMEKFHDSAYPGRIQNLMPNLAQSLDKRGIFARLRRATDSEVTKDDVNFVIKLFSIGQAWFLIDLAIESKMTDSEDWKRCLSSFIYESLWNSPDQLTRRLGECRSTLAKKYRAMWANYATERHKYFNILLDLISSTPTSPLITDTQLPSPPSVPSRGLQMKVRHLRDIINREITAYADSSSNQIFISTPDNLALRIGNTAASHYLRYLKHGTRVQTQELFDSAVELLKSYRNQTVHLNEQEVQYLMMGATMLLSSLLIECPMDIGAQYVMRLLRITEKVKSSQKPLPFSYLSLPLVVYALARHDYPVWDESPPYHLPSRDERAIDVITYYYSHPSELDHISSTMANFGLLELLSEPKYNLNDADFKTISEAFNPGDRANQARIYTLPLLSNTDIYSRSLKGIVRLISDSQRHVLGDVDTKGVAIACLTVLSCAWLDLWKGDASISLGELYAFAIECVLKLSSYASDVEARGQNAALDLMQEFHDHEHPERIQDLMPNLARWLNERNLFAKLKEAATGQGTSGEMTDVRSLFATGQAWSLIDRVIKLGVGNREDWKKSLGTFVGSESLSDLGKLEEQRNNLAEQYQKAWDGDVWRHPYLGYLYGAISSAGVDSSSTTTRPSLGLVPMPQNEPKGPAPAESLLEAFRPTVQLGKTPPRREPSELDAFEPMAWGDNTQLDERWV
ncbi:hypothetical protein RSOLAG22IIIB_11435 [Rhizoctonia solani]|uniref:DUF6535 domain-containing protein n=1 Tax=Rhizoctonia solani TaxID=456999 RepID=A0A0K6G8C3_9AGAM|nr:hypothetical protein RSOLAG22IIIB_11435 [Rhizoctonia solani]